MKITFLRFGHSNNSSSSHSLIFTRQEMPESDESKEFGWQHFTCSSKKDKMNYILSCLFSDFIKKLNMPYLYVPLNENEEWKIEIGNARKTLSDLQFNLFRRWSDIYLGLNLNEMGDGKNYLDCEDFRFGYVDHQSKIKFPSDRSGEKIHHEFAKDFINAFLSENWYVFGGNDNEDGADPPTQDEKSDFEDFRIVWNFLKDAGEIICVKDRLTEEYVLSYSNGNPINSGSIIKIKF